VSANLPLASSTAYVIIVHHLNNSRSQRILWLLEELQLEYRIKRYQRDAKTMLAPAELRKVHPLGKSPVISDQGLILTESGAIIEYLIERHGGGRLAPPRDSAAYLQYRYWLHFAEGSMMSPLLMKLVFDRIESAPMPFFAKPFARAIAQRVKREFIAPRISEHLQYLEATLPAGGWFAGDQISGADIQLSFPLQASASRGGLDARYPKLQEFIARIEARPAYQRALERGGEFEL
jgi:glutathione S-transferase